MSIVAVHTPNMVGDIKLPNPADQSTLAALKADATYGDTASAGKPAWPAGWRTLMDNATYAKWNGTNWVATTPPLYL